MNAAERIIAILVDRLGGDVEISRAELENTDLDLTVGKLPSAFVYILRTHHRPAGGATFAEHLQVTDRVASEMMAEALREIEA